MEDNNKLSSPEYIFYYILWSFVTWIWYDSILFRCVFDSSLTDSRLILLGMLAAGLVAGIFCDMKRNSNMVAIAINIGAVYGIYTVAAYYKFDLPLVRISCRIILIATVGYIFILLCRRIESKRYFRKIFMFRLRVAFRRTRYLVSFGLSMMLLAVFLRVEIDAYLVKPSVNPSQTAYRDLSELMGQNLGALSDLQEEHWKYLSIEDRLDLLQRVANLDQCYLGLPHELNVGAEDLKGGTRGYYEDKAHRIVIDIDCLQNDLVYDAVNTIAHESYHAQEYRMVDVYEGVAEELKNLSFLRQASQYSLEFADYKSVDEESDMDEYVDYYYQELERDARVHAEEFSSWLFSWLAYELELDAGAFRK